MKLSPKHNFNRLENCWRNPNPRAKTRQRFIPNWAMSIYDCRCGTRPPFPMKKHCACAGEETTGAEYWVRLMPGLAERATRNGNTGKCWRLVPTMWKRGEACNRSARNIDLACDSTQRRPKANRHGPSFFALTE